MIRNHIHPQEGLSQVFYNFFLHQEVLVDTQSRGEYLGHKKNQLIFHLDNLFGAFLKKSASQHYNRYVLK